MKGFDAAGRTTKSGTLLDLRASRFHRCTKMASDIAALP
jgi:hypothetical protein